MGGTFRGTTDFTFPIGLGVKAFETEPVKVMPEQKIHELLDFTDCIGDVADPWYTGDFEATWRDVLEGCQCLLEQLIGKL